MSCGFQAYCRLLRHFITFEILPLKAVIKWKIRRPLTATCAIPTYPNIPTSFFAVTKSVTCFQQTAYALVALSGGYRDLLLTEKFSLHVTDCWADVKKCTDRQNTGYRFASCVGGGLVGRSVPGAGVCAIAGRSIRLLGLAVCCICLSQSAERRFCRYERSIIRITSAIDNLCYPPTVWCSLAVQNASRAAVCNAAVDNRYNA